MRKIALGALAALLLAGCGQSNDQNLWMSLGEAA
jgi:hypothetical protein